MSKNKNIPAEGKTLPVKSTRITAIVSVTMVLLLLGIVAMGGMAASRAVTDIRQTMGFVVVMEENASPTQINDLYRQLRNAPYTSSLSYADKDAVLNQWQEMLGPDEDILALTDSINPFSPEIEVKVKAAFAESDTLRNIVAAIGRQPGVEGIKLSGTDIIDSVNRALRRAMTGLSAVAVLLLIISIVLINNTVRLTIYSRRFAIYTMRLVGATGGFIRRPIVGQNIISGLIAGVIASALIGGAIAYGSRMDTIIERLFPILDGAIVMASLPIVGMILCGLTAVFATNKYLRRTRDEIA